MKAIRIILAALLLAVLGLTSCNDPLSPQAELSGETARVLPIPPIPPYSEFPNGIGRLTGVNWFGFETNNMVPHGLWARDYKSMLKQIWDMGFNCLRIPYCDAMLTGKPNGIQINEYGIDAYTKEKGLNVDLAGLNSLQVMDKIIDEAARLGLKIILDNHSRKPDGYMNETLWYTDTVSEDQWVANWVMIAKRYANKPNVIGADLNNEPHGNNGMGQKPPAAWGYDMPGYPHTDWRKAAVRCGQAVVAANPRLIIIVEGVEAYKGQTYWWGGNLQGVKDYPITEIPKSNLVYSAHEYGPEVYAQTWFSDPTFPNNMAAIWTKNFGFVQQQGYGHLFFGEFGIKESSAANPNSIPYKWLKTFMNTYGASSSWTFWAMNPNSGDTGGLLGDDWVSVNTAKYNLIKPYLAPQKPIGDENAKAITSFNVGAYVIQASIIDEAAGTIRCSVPYGTDRSRLTAFYTTTGNAVIVNGMVQQSGVSVNNFTLPVLYTVVAKNGSTKNYTVTVSVVQSSAKEITSFTIPWPQVTVPPLPIAPIVANIDEANRRIFAELPQGFDLKALVVNFTTTGLKVSSAGVPQYSGVTVNNFTQPLVYTVSAQDGSTKDYTVTLTQAVPSAKDILTFSIPSLNLTAQINQADHTIKATVPVGTDRSKLVASFRTTGVKVHDGYDIQESGVTANDFRVPVYYIVVAQDGSAKAYTVTITEAQSSTKDILTFSVATSIGPMLMPPPLYPATIDQVNQTIKAELPSGTPISSLIAFFAINGAKLSVGGVPQLSGTTVNDFSSPLVYTVTAQDGSTKSYRVTITSKVVNDPKLLLGYQASPSALSSNTLGMTLKLSNGGAAPLDLSTITIRYYYTADGTPQQGFACDYAGGNLSPGAYQQITSAVSGSFATVSASNADTYLEIRFSTSAGSLAPGGQLDLNLRIFNSAWTNYNQGNDWSFSSSNSSAKIPVYQNGRLIVGSAP